MDTPAPGNVEESPEVRYTGAQDPILTGAAPDMSQVVSRRRAEIESRKARRSIIIALVVTVALIGIFVVYLMPLIFRLAVSRSSSNTTIGQDDTVPPQIPVFQPPLEFTKDKNLTINGYTEADVQVDLQVDGQNMATASSDQDGKFNLTTELSEGQHQIIVIATDPTGNISQSTQYPVTVDVTAPTLVIDSPADNTTFTVRSEQTQKLQGTMSEPGSVTVNGARVTTADDGKFTINEQLGTGDNKYEIIGYDKAGNQSATLNITLHYQP